MTTALDLLSELRKKGANLWVEDGNIHLQAPSGTLTEELRRALALHKQQILELLDVANAGAQSPAALPIERLVRDRALPLSFAQQRLWFLQQLDPGSTAYNVHFHHRLSGFLNVRALGQSFQEIIRRHESLRTIFASVDGSPVQVITSPHNMSQTVADLTELAESAREEEAHRLAGSAVNRPFDLSTGPLLRSTLLKLAGEEHVWLLDMHHIVSDGWSFEVLRREFGLLYEAFSQGQSSSLPELPVQYGDYAVWQRNWLEGGVLQQQLGYWQQQLQGIPGLLELPTDRPRPAVQSYKGSSAAFSLSPALSGELKALSRREGATLFMTLLAAFQVLLWRYTGQVDVRVGSPIAGRIRPEIEGLIGFFVNTLVLRGKLSGNPTFGEFLSQVRQTTLDAYTHQHVPFEYLVEHLQPERSLSYSPLFQVMFVLQNGPDNALALRGLTVERMASAGDTAKFDLTLTVLPDSSSLQGSVSYNTDLFDEATIRRMIGNFEVLLQGIVTDPERRVSDLPFLTDGEKQQLLVAWSGTGSVHTQKRCIHELFEEQVERTPEAIAAVFEEEEITYKELNVQANQLAHYLRARGVRPEVSVGLCMEPSLDVVVGLLGILKAGGIYVPLDPAYPRQRLAFMIENAQMAVVLTQSDLKAAVSDELSARGTHETTCAPGRPLSIICLDGDAEAIVRQCSDNLFNITEPENIAYAIYTSGSSGVPKGVCVAHGALARHCQTVQRFYELTPADRMLQFAPFNWDPFLNQILTPLITGAATVLRGGAIPTSMDFYRRISRFQLTVVNLSPAYWTQLAQDWEELPGSPDPLRLCHVGGDVMPSDGLSQWYRTPGRSVPLTNVYGPTEAVIAATIHRLAGDTVPARIPIGRPLAGRCVYVCDRGLDLVPVGVRGELLIGGPTLARSYLSRPDLTAEKFIPNPFRSTGTTRLYRTGDTVRYLSDGDLEFLGRVDRQVKIRGFRIELGEIEAVLLQHPMVREAVVVIRTPTSDDRLEADPRRRDADLRRLVGYVVPKGRSAPGVSELRTFLKEKLPDYMVPQSFVMLSELPFTPNGKLDRKALPSAGTALELERVYVAPRTQTEKLLAKIWSDTLGLERVGIHDNFFELGGHSLLAMRVMSRVAETFEIAPELRMLFDEPTIAGLAEALDVLCWALKNSEVVPPSGDDDTEEATLPNSNE